MGDQIKNKPKSAERIPHEVDSDDVKPYSITEIVPKAAAPVSPKVDDVAEEGNQRRGSAVSEQIIDNCFCR